MPAYKDNATGKWYVKFQIQGKDGKIKQFKKRGFATKKAALAYEIETKATFENSSSMLFSTFYYDKYLPFEEVRLKATSLLSKRFLIERHILPYFGSMPVSSIDVQTIIDWHVWLMHKEAKNKDVPLSPASLALIHGRMHHIMKHAIKVLDLPRDVVALAGTIGHQPKVKNTYLTIEEFIEFDKELSEGKYNPECHYICLLMFFSGIRIGEALALQVSDFNMEAKTVTISKTLSKVKRKTVVTSPKTESSIRTLKLPDIVVSEMQTYISSLYDAGEDDRIFTVSRYTVNRAIHNAAKKVGIEREVSCHSMRHSMASLLLSEGYSIADVGRRLGHAWLGTTMRYVHSPDDNQDKMVDTLNNLAATKGTTESQ